jgi:hypothetical protein
VRSAVGQDVATAFIETQADQQLVGRNSLRRFLMGNEPLADEIALVQAHRTKLRKKLGAPCVHVVIGIAILRLGNADDGGPNRAIVIERLLVDVIEECAQRVEVLLCGRIELVIVADGAPDGNAHECSAIRFGSVARDVEVQLFRNRSALVAAFAQAHVAAGNERIEVFSGEQVTGDLLAGELIKWLVAVERVNHVMAELSLTNA